MIIRFWIPIFALAFALSAISCTSSDDDDDDDDDSDDDNASDDDASCTQESLCQWAVDCGVGYTSVEDCMADAEAYAGTEEDMEAILACSCACLDSTDDCTDAATCGEGCWAGNF